MLRFLINGELMTSEEYMSRHQVSYLRAIHEITKHVNNLSMQSVERRGALGTRRTTGGNIGGATDETRRGKTRLG
jgi:hypothetical protein